MLAAFSGAMAERLVFEGVQLALELPPDEQTAAVTFAFTNRAKEPVIVREVRTECDCVRASVSPMAIAPGESGTVSLDFRARIRNGTEVIRAEVVTAQGESYPLSVSVKLRSYIEVTPRALQWDQHEPRRSKEFVVRSTGLGKLRFLRVAIAGAGSAEMLPGSDADSIRVQVSPPAESQSFQAVVIVTAALAETNDTKLYDLPVRGR